MTDKKNNNHCKTNTIITLLRIKKEIMEGSVHHILSSHYAHGCECVMYIYYLYYATYNGVLQYIHKLKTMR